MSYPKFARTPIQGIAIGLLFGSVVIFILILAAVLGRAATYVHPASPPPGSHADGNVLMRHPSGVYDIAAPVVPNDDSGFEAGVMIIPPSPFCIPAAIAENEVAEFNAKNGSKSIVIEGKAARDFIWAWNHMLPPLTNMEGDRVWFVYFPDGSTKGMTVAAIENHGQLCHFSQMPIDIIAQLSAFGDKHDRDNP